MIGIRSRLIFLQVTGAASGGKPLIDAARMALRATRGSVLAGQRERRLRGVVERGAAPVRGAMAELTILREAGGDMVGIVGALVVSQVAGIARGGQTLVNAARMALNASCREMFSGQWERGLSGVIELGSAPIDRGMAEGTILRESGGHVVWIGGALVFLQVA